MTWTATDLGVLSGGAYSIALAASSDGSVIVGQGDTGSSGGSSHAFSWTSGGGLVDLGSSRTWVFRIRYSGSARPAIIGTYVDHYKGLG